MMTAVRTWLDHALGRGKAAITVPVFDGAFKPNQLLQQASVVCRLDEPEDVASDGQSLYVADGTQVLRISAEGVATPMLALERTITALACIEGGFAVALDGTDVRVIGGRFDGRCYTEVNGRPFKAVNALAVNGACLIVTDGSAVRSYAQWRHDLMERGHSGRACELNLANHQTRELATGLEYVFGAAVQGSTVLVSESWHHRVVALATGQPPKVVLGRMPGYPSRLAAAAGGGFWLTVFTARTQLVEFVLRESEFRRRMVATIDPDLWVAPQLRSWQSFHEPLQYARLKKLGHVKPWAPPRSYGLVVRLDQAGLPLYSLHCRADGTYHGVVAAVELGRQLFVLSKGDRVLLRLNMDEVERNFSYEHTAIAANIGNAGSHEAVWGRAGH